MSSWLLTLITFLPIVGMVGVLAIPSNNHKAIRWFSAGVTGVVFLLTLVLWSVVDLSNLGSDMNDVRTWYDQGTFVEVAWIPAFAVNYRMGVDGLSLVLIILTGFLAFLATFSGFTIEKHVKGFFAMYLLLLTGMMGVFMALDFLPVLRFLGNHAAADVLPHRHLGRTAPRVRRHQVLPLHAGRLDPDPDRHAGLLLPDADDRRRGLRAPGLQHPGTDPAPALRRPDRRACPSTVQLPALPRAVHRLRGQGAHLPVPHLAARRPRRGPDGDLRHPGRRAAEDGRLRHYADQLAAACPMSPSI
jgi:hypothetical protein